MLARRVPFVDDSTGLSSTQDVTKNLDYRSRQAGHFNTLSSLPEASKEVGVERERQTFLLSYTGNFILLVLKVQSVELVHLAMNTINDMERKKLLSFTS